MDNQNNQQNAQSANQPQTVNSQTVAANQPQVSAGANAAPAQAVAPQAGQAGAQTIQSGSQKPQLKPGTPLPKDQTKSNRKIVYGCVSAFGCSIFLFIGAILAFLAFGSTSNPIFSFLGSSPAQVVDVLIGLVNLIFLALVFIAFIFFIVGTFKLAAVKKDDKEGKIKAAVWTFVSLGIMVFLIFIWIFVYYFLAPKRTGTPSVAIATTPAATINLTGPVTIKFDATRAPINRNQFEILSYTWDFGDKTTLVGNPQSHTYTEVGNYKVKLTIGLREKATGTESNREFLKDVTIANIRARVVIDADNVSGGAPLTVHFDGSDSSSSNGEITAYAWDLNEDGQYQEAATATTEKTFTRVGTYKVSLRVTDSTGTFSTGDLQITVTPPDDPVAIITVEGVTGSSSLETGKAYLFSASASTSPSGTIERYSWDFGDGTRASTRSATHTFEDAGTYEVTLKVTDSTRKEGETTERFSVAAPSSGPVASIRTTPEAVNNIVSGQAPFAVVFDASGSQDPNNNIVEYEWNFGDESEKNSNQTASHTFTQSGTYNVNLTVTDSTDLTGTLQVVVRVESPGLRPNLAAEPIAGVVPLTVRFDASGSSYTEGRIVNYQWDFGDGSAPRIDTSNVSYQYTAVGTFTAKVTAITNDGKQATAQILINVRPVPLQACFDPTVTSGVSPLEVEFDPTCSSGTVVRYRWNFAGLGTSSDRKPKFTFRDPGEYEVSLEVADNQNVVDTFTKKITVTAPQR